MVFLTSNKGGTIAIEWDIMGSGPYWPCELTDENKDKTLLVVSTVVGLEKQVNIFFVVITVQVKITPYRYSLNSLTLGQG